MIKSFKRSGSLLCLVDLLSDWYRRWQCGFTFTEDGNADSPSQSVSMGEDAGLTEGVSGSGRRNRNPVNFRKRFNFFR